MGVWIRTSKRTIYTIKGNLLCLENPHRCADIVPTHDAQSHGLPVTSWELLTRLHQMYRWVHQHPPGSGHT
ncbi:hypothetical protein EMPG_17002 [Blastomyces silverae]|uniref:Uncharacterized protein n=1 Tax=Blastomyces silverae TaxID=2060906 RepID=A0A0H1B7U7_9EURO|nr:hypothetical protein EMPG_17002 [Blastomyces silverae]